MGDLVLEKKLFAATVAINKEFFFDEVRVSDAIEFTANRLVVVARKAIYGNPLGQVEYEFPATPYEHFRARYFPKLGRVGRWWLKRKPIRHSYHVQSAWAMFPESTWVYPKDLGRAVIALYDPDDPLGHPSFRGGGFVGGAPRTLRDTPPYNDV